jgi:hypothetical protein
LNKPVKIYVPCGEDDLVSRQLKDIEGVWHRPVIVYVHTPEELLKLKKKWAAEVWSDANDRQIFGKYSTIPNKQDYINNLTI